MSLFQLALAYVGHRRLVTLLTVVGVALGTSLVLVVLNLRREVERTFLRQSHNVDLVVGATGSESALVLTALFHADQPRGNISYEAFQGLQRQRGVINAFPFNLGDRYRDVVIVGATKEFLSQKRDGEPVFTFAKGRCFERDFEIVLGSEAAARHGLTVGNKIVGSHGAAASDSHFGSGKLHREFPYQVVGILSKTGSAHDRAAFTTLGSYWTIHDKSSTALSSPPKQVTVVLVQTAKPLLLQLQQLIPRKFGVMAVRPSEVLNRMFEQVLSPLEKALLVYGAAVALVAAASVLSTLYLATLLRRKDLAILRALGAVPSELFTVILFEALILLVVGCGLGVLLSQCLTVLVGGGLEQRFGFALQLFQFNPAEIDAIGAIIASGLVASLLPAWLASRRDVGVGIRD